MTPAAPKYFGKPCIHGHPGERYTSNYGCVECIRARARKAVDRGPRNRYMRDYRNIKRELVAEYGKNRLGAVNLPVKTAASKAHSAAYMRAKRDGREKAGLKRNPWTRSTEAGKLYMRQWRKNAGRSSRWINALLRERDLRSAA